MQIQIFPESASFSEILEKLVPQPKLALVLLPLLAKLALWWSFLSPNGTHIVLDQS
jgi:hypothetical protein